MMKVEKYDDLAVDLKEHLKRLGDIINIDGPVLSLFMDKRNADLYLFDWVDSDGKANRWLIYKIPAEILNDFLLRKISYKNMFDWISESKIYFTDISYDIDNVDKIDYRIEILKDLPENYKATKDNFFDINDSKDFEKIITTVSSLINEKEDDLNKIDFYNESTHFITFGQDNIDFEATKKETKINNDIPSFHPTLLIQQNAPTRNRILQRERVGLRQ